MTLHMKVRFDFGPLHSKVRYHWYGGNGENHNKAVSISDLMHRSLKL